MQLGVAHASRGDAQSGRAQFLEAVATAARDAGASPAPGATLPRPPRQRARRAAGAEIPRAGARRPARRRSLNGSSTACSRDESTAECCAANPRPLPDARLALPRAPWRSRGTRNGIGVGHAGSRGLHLRSDGRELPQRLHLSPAACASRSLSRARTARACQTPVRAYDNIPILSYLILRGRCRACGIEISPRYPLVEALTGIAAVAAFLHFGWRPDCPSPSPSSAP